MHLPLIYNRADCRFAPSQWQTLLQSNNLSHWLGTNLESALYNTLARWSNSSVLRGNYTTNYGASKLGPRVPPCGTTNKSTLSRQDFNFCCRWFSHLATAFYLIKVNSSWITKNTGDKNEMWQTKMVWYWVIALASNQRFGDGSTMQSYGCDDKNPVSKITKKYSHAQCTS